MFKTIIWATDGSENADRALPYARGLAGAPDKTLVVVHVKEHPLFRRDGPNLMVDLPITLPQAVLGADVKVPTLEDSSRLAIPPGTQHGTIFCLRGKGLPRPGAGPRGDLYVTVALSVPAKPSRRQRELYQQLLEMDEPARPTSEDKEKDIFGRVKDIFS